jgi:hypothetical protein
MAEIPRGKIIGSISAGAHAPSGVRSSAVALQDHLRSVAMRRCDGGGATRASQVRVHSEAALGGYAVA